MLLPGSPHSTRRCRWRRRKTRRASSRRFTTCAADCCLPRAMSALVARSTSWHCTSRRKVAISSAKHRRKVDSRTHFMRRAAEAMAEECVGWILTNCGRYAEARGPLEHGLALSREIGMRRFETVCLVCLARVLWAEGSKDEARQVARAAWKLCEEFSPRFAGPSALGTIAHMTESDDERREALAAAERLLEQGCVGHSQLQFYVSAIDVALEQREWSEAERYANALEEYSSAEPLAWVDFYAA